jgi:hypothetical protein
MHTPSERSGAPRSLVDELEISKPEGTDRRPLAWRHELERAERR